MYKCMYYVSHGRYMYITELVKFEDMNYYSHVVYVLIFHCKYYLFMTSMTLKLYPFRLYFDCDRDSIEHYLQKEDQLASISVKSNN